MNTVQIKDRELRIEELKDIIHGLYVAINNPRYKFGIAGSFARGNEKKDSDVDVVISGTYMLSADEYNKITSYLKKELQKEFDLLNLEALEKEDEELDSMLLDMGLGINDRSTFKNIIREVIWIE